MNAREEAGISLCSFALSNNLNVSHKHKTRHLKLLTTILLSSVFTGWVILIIATPRLQRIPKEMRKPMEERMAIWYRFDIKASQHEQLGSSNRSTVLFSIPAPEAPFWPAPPKLSPAACFGGFANSWLFCCCIVQMIGSNSWCVDRHHVA